MTLEAKRLRRLKKDPAATLRRARGFLDRALELEDSVTDFYLADARWYLEEAEWLRATDRDFTEAVAAGLRSLTEARRWTEESIEVSRLEANFEEINHHQVR